MLTIADAMNEYHEENEDRMNTRVSYKDKTNIEYTDYAEQNEYNIMSLMPYINARG